MKQALLLVDLQNDFCRDGTLAVNDGDATIEVANRLIDHFQQNGWPIIASLDWHPANHKSFAINSASEIGQLGVLNGLPQVWWPVHCVQNSRGAELQPKLNQNAIDRLFFKGQDPEVDSYSTFFDNGKRRDTGLNAWLQSNGVKHLTIMGLATDYCVKFSVLDALELGYQVEVIVDGCRGINLQPQDSQTALAEMKKHGAHLTQLQPI